MEGDALLLQLLENQHLLLESQRQAKEERAQLSERLDKIEKALSLNVVKEAYTVEEVAERVGKKPFTVRQWCNRGQIRATRNRRAKGTHIGAHNGPTTVQEFRGNPS